MARPILTGTKVRRLRRDAGLTQVDLAAQLGISASYLNLIEHNQRALTRPLLLKLGEVLRIDPHTLSGSEEARLLSDLAEVFADSVFGGQRLSREEIADVVAAAPSAARAIRTLHRSYRRAREDAVGLSEHLTDNPFLEAANHRLLTLLTSIRSFAEILRDNADLAVTRRQQYIGTVAEESEKLTDLVNEVFGFLGGEGLSNLRAIDTPAEEVLDYIQAAGNHFAALETAAEALRRTLDLAPENAAAALTARLEAAHGVSVSVQPNGTGAAGAAVGDANEDRLILGEFLPSASRTFLIAQRLALAACPEVIDAQVEAAGLSTPAAQRLLRGGLANYLAAALLMPYDDFADMARSARHDIELLQQRFGVSFEQACHRLVTLHRQGAEGVPFHFVRLDVAGNIVKRFTASGMPIPRFRGACPRWNVHTTFMWPGRIDTQLARLPNGACYVFVSRAGTKPAAGYRTPRTHYAISIGCDVSFADQLVYADGLDLTKAEAAVPVGIHCRQCEREDCAQRAFPALLH